MAIPEKKPYEQLSKYLERVLPGELEAGKSRGKATADIIAKFNAPPKKEMFAPFIIPSKFGFANNAAADGLDIPTDGLYAWWDFNNESSYTSGSLTVTDLSGNGNNGVVGNILTTALDGDVRYVQGNDIVSLENAIHYPGDVTTDLATASYCIVIKMPFDKNQVFWSGYPNVDGGTYIGQTGGGNFAYQFVGSPTAYSNETIDSSAVVPGDGWKLRTWTGLDSTNSRFSTGFMIGGYQNDWDLSAQIIAILVYDRAITAGEVSQIYTAYDTVIDLDI
jgi:hypothetical protein